MLASDKTVLHTEAGEAAHAVPARFSQAVEEPTTVRFLLTDINRFFTLKWLSQWCHNERHLCNGSRPLLACLGRCTSLVVVLLSLTQVYVVWYEDNQLCEAPHLEDPREMKTDRLMSSGRATTGLSAVLRSAVIFLRVCAFPAASTLINLRET